MNKDQERCYQIYDWYCVDENIDNDDSSESDQLEFSEKISKVYMMYMFGVSDKGNNACIKVTGFEPFFWIELPDNWIDSWTSSLLYELRDKLPRRMKDEIITNRIKDCVHSKYRFRDYQWEKKRKFMKLEFKSEAALRSVYYRIKEGKTNPRKRITINTKIKNHVFPIYEKNITPVLRMIHMRNIKPTGWVSIKNAKYTKTSFSESNFRRNWTVDWKDVYPADNNSIGPIKVASFDIEADSSHGDFPVAKKDYTKLAQNIYEEFIRTLKQKQRVSPSMVKRWIKCAFRDYYPSEIYEDSIKSSIQTIILKNKPNITNREFDTIGLECYRELVKTNSSTENIKAKEIAESINNLLCSALPPVMGDKVIQIGTVLYRYGMESTTIQRHIVTLGGCDEIEGVEVVSCETVSELYNEWAKFMAKAQPNIITGYNIFGFDFKFLWECAEEYGCLNKLIGMGPMKGIENKLGSKELFSAAMGHNFLYYFEMPGMVTIDLLKVIQREHNLSSYKLDDVSNEFINGSISSFEFEENKMIVNTQSTFSLRPGHYLAIYKSSIIGKEYLGERRKILEIVENEKIIMESSTNDQNIEWPKKSVYWCVGKDNVSPQDIFEMQRGSDSDRAIVAKYCVQDCELCLNLMQKLEIITNNVGMSNVCLVPFSYLFMRGQMIKTLSLVSSECSKENYMIPELPGKTDENSKDSYEGAEVLEPKPAIFLDEPVSVLDYSSLYPSSMIGSNISHDTIIKDKMYLGETGAKILEDMGIQFEDISYDNYDSVLIGKTWHKRVNESEPIVTCRYVQPPKDESGAVIDSKRGILPRILMKLLKARKETRAMIKKEKDPFRRSVLDGLQLAYKITANSLYGGVGAEVSALYYKDIAASTTAVGRAHLHLAKDYVNEHYPKAEVVYGDSVVSDTPLLLRQNDKIIIMSPEDLYNQFQKIGPFENDEYMKSYVDCLGYDVWTDSGWTKVNQIMRHKVNKKIIRVLTHGGCVDVTEDHSLLDKNGNAVTPKDLDVGDELLLSFPKEFDNVNSNTNISPGFARILGFFMRNGTCGFYKCPSGDKSSWKIANKDIVKIKEYLDLCSKEIPEFEWKFYNTKNRNSFIYNLVFSSNVYGKKLEYIKYFRDLMYHNISKSKQVPNIILNSSIEIRKQFLIGLYDADGQKSMHGVHKTFDCMGVTSQSKSSCGCCIDQKGKIAAFGIYTLLKSIGYNVSINTRDSKPNVYRISFTNGKLRKIENSIKKIIELNYDEQYVYDLSTENHHFHAGVGSCIVHNTDSIFVNFKCTDENGNKMSPEKALQASIDKSIEVEKGIQPLLQYPHCLEYEKTFLPFVLLRKKGYIGNKYEFDVKKYKQTSMGVVTKRRDNAPILKYVYDGIINRIINDRDIDSSIDFLKDCINKILSGHFPMQYFIITKKLNAFYAFPDQIVHKALADRMGERDPGNKPQSNDRIPYVYINTKCAVKLQGDRVEHPDYIKENNLKIDYLFYITNQIVKPCCQVYALTLESLRKYGYKKESDYFERLENKMRSDPKKNKNIREKIMALKSDEAYKVLFEKRVKIEEGKKFGQKSITNYFKKR
tara:strand:+ start:2842 stop:7548 length:4707 start_codon:yes stop_codon:yes gene_type:complete